MLRAEKRKQVDRTNRIIVLQDQLLPNKSLEERQRNFSEYYLAYGHDLIIALKIIKTTRTSIYYLRTLNELKAGIAS